MVSEIIVSVIMMAGSRCAVMPVGWKDWKQVEVASLALCHTTSAARTLSLTSWARSGLPTYPLSPFLRVSPLCSCCHVSSLLCVCFFSSMLVFEICFLFVCVVCPFSGF